MSLKENTTYYLMHPCICLIFELKVTSTSTTILPKHSVFFHHPESPNKTVTSFHRLPSDPTIRLFAFVAFQPVRAVRKKPAYLAVYRKYTLQGIHISHLGKRKIIFKMPFCGDMLVPWRVLHSYIGDYNKLLQGYLLSNQYNKMSATGFQRCWFAFCSGEADVFIFQNQFDQLLCSITGLWFGSQTGP